MAAANANVEELPPQRARDWFLAHIRVFLHAHAEATIGEAEEEAQRLRESSPPLIRDNLSITDALRFAQVEHRRVGVMHSWGAR